MSFVSLYPVETVRVTASSVRFDSAVLRERIGVVWTYHGPQLNKKTTKGLCSYLNSMIVCEFITNITITCFKISSNMLVCVRERAISECATENYECVCGRDMFVGVT